MNYDGVTWYMGSTLEDLQTYVGFWLFPFTSFIKTTYKLLLINYANANEPKAIINLVTWRFSFDTFPAQIGAFLQRGCHLHVHQRFSRLSSIDAYLMYTPDVQN